MERAKHHWKGRHGSSLGSLSAIMAFLLGASPLVDGASDTDVYEIKAKSVTIEDGKIVITGEARIKMRVFTPGGAPAAGESQFLGRPAAWVEVLAEEATFTVRRPPQGKEEWWQEMSVEAAKALRNGEEIGRIGFYRPEVTIRGNAVQAISGFGFIYPKSE